MGEAYVGILVNANTYRGIPKGKTHYESLSAYEEAGKRYGIVPCFMRIEDVNPNAMMTKAYIKTRYGYRRLTIPIPYVIHNRAIYFRAASHELIYKLVQQGIRIFNQFNRYGKMTIHQQLHTDPGLHPFLPETVQMSPTELSRMMQKYNTLIIKPNNSSLGRGIIKLNKSSSHWTARISAHDKKTVSRTVRFTEGMLPMAIQSRIAKEPYIVQQYVPLATYRGRPFDLRVSVQRNESEYWQVTGIVAKIAPSHTFVTNLAKGGTSMMPKQLFEITLPHCNPDFLMEQVSHLAIQIATKLQYVLPHIADLGLDIGMTEDGTPQFIECNGRDQRYSFREAGMYDVWRSTFSTPIAYASTLIRTHATTT